MSVIKDNKLNRVLIKKEGKTKSFGVLLLKSIKGCGKFGQIVYLKPGYANFLQKQQAAEFATKDSLNLAEQNLEILHKKNEELEQHAAEQKIILENLENLHFIYSASAHGRLHGSITSSNIADKINSLTNLNISPSQIKCHHIKTVGEHSATIDLSYLISYKLIFYIASSEIEYKKYLTEKNIVV